MIDNLTKEELEEIERILNKNIDEYISKYIFKDEKNIDELLKNIKLELNLKNYPYKIVCIDISHTNGKNTSGGLSAMIGGILSKKHYRQFKVPDEYSQNDYASLKYCLNKYFKNNSADLVILDGGKGQLGIIEDFDNNTLLKTDFISIGKGKARKRKGKIIGEKEKIYTLDKEIEIDYNKIEHKLLIKLRDEAHRFSNKYRKKQEKLI